ncbi:MAG: membrane dipeptidase, partial [Planctomycetota bacterium]|nr:membrane dipeptidase [Planctomycetota bacterium]
MSNTEYWENEKHVLELHFGTRAVMSYVNPSMEWQPDGTVSFDTLIHGGYGTQASIPRMRKGGVRIVILSIGPPPFRHRDHSLFGREKVDSVIKQLAVLNDLKTLSSGDCEIVTSMTEADEVVSRGGLAAFLHLTGALHLNDLGILREYYNYGVRSIHPPFDDSEERTPLRDSQGPLNDEGRKTLAEMEKLGMLIDLSHATDELFPGVFESTETTLVATHSNARALSDNWRNHTDEQILQIAERGGVIGMHCGLMSDDKPPDPNQDNLNRQRSEREAKLTEEPDGNPYHFFSRRWTHRHWHYFESDFWRERGGNPCPPLGWMIDHLDHMVRLTGIDHVGIGADFDLDTPPVGFEEPDKFPNVTREMLNRGYSDEDVIKT